MSTKIKTILTILDHTVLQHYNFNIALQSSEKHYNSTNHIIHTAIKLIQCSATNGSELILLALSKL